MKNFLSKTGIALLAGLVSANMSVAADWQYVTENHEYRIYFDRDTLKAGINDPREGKINQGTFKYVIKHLDTGGVWVNRFIPKPQMGYVVSDTQASCIKNRIATNYTLFDRDGHQMNPYTRERTFRTIGNNDFAEKIMRKALCKPKAYPLGSVGDVKNHRLCLRRKPDADATDVFSDAGKSMSLAKEVVSRYYGPYDEKTGSWRTKVDLEKSGIRARTDLHFGTLTYGMKIAKAQKVMIDGKETLQILVIGSPVSGPESKSETGNDMQALAAMFTGFAKNHATPGLLSVFVVSPFKKPHAVASGAGLSDERPSVNGCYVVDMKAFNTLAGWNGEPPQTFNLVRIGKGVSAWQFETTFAANGQQDTFHHFIYPWNGGLTESSFLVSSTDDGGNEPVTITADYAFDSDTNGPYYAVKYTARKKDKRKTTVLADERIPFDHDTGLYHVPAVGQE